VQLNPDSPDEIPILNIANHNKSRKSDPSEAYRNVIAAGLKETYPAMTQVDIEEYFDKCKLGL